MVLYLRFVVLIIFLNIVYLSCPEDNLVRYMYKCTSLYISVFKSYFKGKKFSEKANYIVATMVAIKGLLHCK